MKRKIKLIIFFLIAIAVWMILGTLITFINLSVEVTAALIIIMGFQVGSLCGKLYYKFFMKGDS